MTNEELLRGVKTAFLAGRGAERSNEPRRACPGTVLDGLAFRSLCASRSLVLGLLVPAGVMGSGESIKLADAGA